MLPEHRLILTKMKFTTYQIQKGDTLESIAEKQGCTVKQLVQFHNQHAEMTQQIYGDHIPLHIRSLNLSPQKITTDDFESGEIDEGVSARYRCEQTVVTKLNGIPTNTANTKREFQLRKLIKHGKLLIGITILDNIIEMNPNQYQEALDLVSELDFIKCDGVILKVNNLSGEIDSVENHLDIIDKWNEHRKVLESKYSFIKNSEGKEAVKQFIDKASAQIMDEKSLIDDFRTKMFFEVIFNKHVVNATDKMEDYRRNVYSQLFEGEIIELRIRQDLLRESEDQILVRKESSISDAAKHSTIFEKKYDEKFKPILKYKFSEYNASYRERVVYNDKMNLPEEGEVTIIEEVKNNIQLLVTYNYRKID